MGYSFENYLAFVDMQIITQIKWETQNNKSKIRILTSKVSIYLSSLAGQNLKKRYDRVFWFVKRILLKNSESSTVQHIFDPFELQPYVSLVSYANPKLLTSAILRQYVADHLLTQTTLFLAHNGWVWIAVSRRPRRQPLQYKCRLCDPGTVEYYAFQLQNIKKEEKRYLQ